MIPVISIGGFLGSGKTTLVNHVLANPQGRRLAVIVNDIGAINIDDQLIENSDENRIALTNGCICCSLKSDLFDAVQQLCNDAPELDAIVIEASGISNPAALITSLKLLESAKLAHAETLVYLIDTCSFSDLDFDDAENVLDNAPLCDLLVLNKIDITSDSKRRDLVETLQTVAPHHRVIETQFAQVSSELLFAPVLSKAMAINESELDGLIHHGYREITISSNSPISRPNFEVFMVSVSTFAWRAKGFVTFRENADEVYLINMVGKRLTIEAYERSAADADFSSTLVIIGKDDEMPDDLSFGSAA
jgi:G3E family GTPase